MRLLILILFAILALFQYDLWFGRKGFESIEERARMQHGMVKENEVFYHIVKENK